MVKGLSTRSRVITCVMRPCMADGRDATRTWVPRQVIAYRSGTGPGNIGACQLRRAIRQGEDNRPRIPRQSGTNRVRDAAMNDGGSRAAQTQAPSRQVIAYKFERVPGPRRAVRHREDRRTHPLTVGC